MFSSDKLPELWISISAPSLKENSATKTTSLRNNIHFHEVWRAGKVTPRMNEETVNLIPEQNGKVNDTHAYFVIKTMIIYSHF